MASQPETREDSTPERRVAVVCPQCSRGYKIVPALLGRRLVCKDCRKEWRARRVTAEEIRNSLAAHRGAPITDSSGSPGTLDITSPAGSSDLPPPAGSSVAIDMSWTGKRIGRYKAQSLLGYGGMGVVWRAHDDKLRRDVALKILSSTRDDKAKGGLNLDLFMQEARAVAKLQHPAVVSIYEVDEDQGHVFLSLELMEGGTLKEYVDKKGPIEPRQLFRWMAAPTRALGLAHRRGVVHRDIKPGNLMFDDHGHLKLMDFGLADVTNEAVSERLRGKAVGSLGWIAPETAKGKQTTALSDIYSMGLVTLYALTGKPLINGKSRSEMISLHQSPPAPELDGIAGLTPRARAMLQKCLEVDPARRFESAEALADEFQACADETTAQPRPRRRAGMSTAVLAAAIGIFAGVGATLYYVLDLMNEQQSLSTPGAIVTRVTPNPAPLTDASPTSADRPAVTDENGRLPWPRVIAVPHDQFVASARGSVFHRADAKCGAQDIHYANLVILKSLEEAKAGGRRPCPQCKPDDTSFGASVPPRHDVVIGPEDH